MSSPRISICLPNLNTRRFLEERMETILAQTVSDWELIICDSHSDDGSWEYFQQFKGDPRIQMHQVPRAGVYAGWNECLRRANGKYIYMATSDDTMSPDCIEKLVAPLERFPDVRISACDFQKIDAQGASMPMDWFLPHQFLGEWMKIPCRRNGRTEFVLHAGFGSTIWFTMTSVLFRRDLLAQTGLFPIDLGSRGDEAWTLRASLASDIAFVPGKLATWRVHPDQATGRWKSHWRAEMWLHNSMQSVLRDSRSGFPTEWRNDRDLLAALSLAHSFPLYHNFRLTRWDARRSPVAFAKDLFSAAKYAPSLLAHEIRTGFRYDASNDLDRIANVKRLLERTCVPWPPTPLSTN